MVKESEVLVLLSLLLLITLLLWTNRPRVMTVLVLFPKESAGLPAVDEQPTEPPKRYGFGLA